jgi:hypothetical protein
VAWQIYFLLSEQTVGNILRRHGLSPAPKRKQAISWKDFIRSHMEVQVGTDFFTVEVLTLKGLVTFSNDQTLLIVTRPRTVHVFCEHLSPVDESACNPKPKSVS